MYSAKILRDKIFTDRPLANFRGINFADQAFLLTTPSRRPHALFVLTVATTPSSAARFQIQAFLLRGELCLGPSRFVLLELINYASQARDASPLTNALDVEGSYEGGTQESRSVRFETTMERHVALDIHTILQNGITIICYQTILHNLTESFEELNFHGMRWIRKNHQNYVPWKFGAIQ